MEDKKKINTVQEFYENYEKEHGRPNLLFLFIFVIVIAFLGSKMAGFFEEYEFIDFYNFFKDFSEDNKSLIYFLIFFFAMGESTIILASLPGTMAVLIFSSLVAAGVLSFWLVFVLVFIGAIVGDNIGYFLGRKLGKEFLVDKAAIFDPLAYKTTVVFMKKHGPKSVALARFANITKEFLPFIAGTVKMNRLKFQIYNLLGALAWAAVLISLGVLFYNNLEFINDNLGKIFTFLTFVYLFIFFLFYRKNKEKILNS